MCLGSWGQWLVESPNVVLSADGPVFAPIPVEHTGIRASLGDYGVSLEDYLYIHLGSPCVQ